MLITDEISCTNFKIMLFSRDHKCFGNMILVIANDKQRLEFITDRDDIFCNSKLVVEHGYHVAGKDDCPLYLVLAIKDSINNL